MRKEYTIGNVSLVIIPRDGFEPPDEMIKEKVSMAKYVDKKSEELKRMNKLEADSKVFEPILEPGLKRRGYKRPNEDTLKLMERSRSPGRWGRVMKPDFFREKYSVTELVEIERGRVFDCNTYFRDFNKVLFMDTKTQYKGLSIIFPDAISRQGNRGSRMAHQLEVLTSSQKDNGVDFVCLYFF